MANIDNRKNFLVDKSKSLPSLQYKLQTLKFTLQPSFYWTVYACVIRVPLNLGRQGKLQCSTSGDKYVPRCTVCVAQ